MRASRPQLMRDLLGGDLYQSQMLPLRSLLLAVLASLTTSADATGQNLMVRWTVVHGALNEKGQVLRLGDSVEVVQLKGSWSCAVGAPSKHLPRYEARTTTCSKGSDSFEFSVQCEPQRPKDHGQIRLRGTTRQSADFIEVACELLGATP